MSRKGSSYVVDADGVVAEAAPLVNFYRSSGERGDIDEFSPSLTRQEFAAECDINTIMARYEAGGAFSHVNRAEPIYMDVTEFPDLRGAMDAMRVAGEAFASLPARVRREFDNDPQRFVDFAQDPKNLDQMGAWGLADLKKVAPSPIDVKVVNEPPPGGGASDTPPPGGGGKSSRLV